MTLSKQINYYRDSNSKYRRIPWDSWYEDGTFIGLSPAPVPIGIEFSTAGAMTIQNDFFDTDQGEDISGIIIRDSEEDFLDDYDDVTFGYISDFAQTYETDYHEKDRQE